MKRSPLKAKRVPLKAKRSPLKVKENPPPLPPCGVTWGSPWSGPWSGQQLKSPLIVKRSPWKV